MILRHIAFLIVCLSSVVGCSNDPADDNAVQAETPIASSAELTGHYTYECEFWSKGREAAGRSFVRTASTKPVLEEEEWQVGTPRGLAKAKKTEWGTSEGGSFALTWTESDGRSATAYLSFGDIPDKNGAQPLSAEIEFDGQRKMKFNRCGVPPLEPSGVEG